MKKQIFILFIFLLVNLTVVQAQKAAPAGSGVISGKIEDSREHIILEYANVILFNSKDSSMYNGAVTDTNGNFTIINIPVGQYYLTADFIGYHKTVIGEIVISKETPNINIGTIGLQPASSQINGVEVVGEIQEVQYKIDKKVINVSKNINATGGSAVDALRSVPSVNVDAEGNVTIRGSASFTVLVDGRPVSQNGNDVLKQTPASAIENIEVITNPSAKYDPDGTAGIINLVMKKNRSDGINGIVNLSYGTFNKYSTDFQLNVKTGKFNFFVGGEYRNRVDNVTQVIEKTLYNSDTNQMNFAEVKQKYHPWNYRINLGADWNIDDNNALSVSGSYFRQNFNVSTPVYYHLFSEPGIAETWLAYNNNISLLHHWTEGNVNYKHSFKKPGHQISVSAVYNRWNGDKTDMQVKSTTDSDWINILTNDAQRRRFYDNKSARFSGDIDYVLPVNDKIKIEAGYSGDITTFNSVYTVDNYDSDFERWITDSSLSNGFDFDYSIHAVYGTMSGEIWKMGYQIGFRGEYFKRELVTQVPDTNYSMEIWSLFPTFHLSKEFKKGHQLQFSYSRRVNRPDIMALNPLPYFNDEFLMHKGNPALRPEYGNSFELNYQKIFGESFLSVETYYRMTTDKMAETIRISTGQTLLTTENLTSDWAAGLTAMANIKIAKFFKIDVSTDVFKYHLKGNKSGEVPTREQFSASFSINPSFNFKTGTVIQIQSFYNTPGVDPIGEMDGFFMLNAAVKQDFFKRKFSITLSANNLFNLTKYSYTDRTDAYLHHFDYIPEGNIFNITLSYKINNYIRKAPQNQGGGAIDVSF